MICFSSQCINRQSPFPLLTRESTCFFTAACSVPFSFCVIPHLSYVFSISPASYVFLSRFQLPCPLFLSLSSLLTSIDSLLSYPLSSTMLTKTLSPQRFHFFTPPEANPTIFFILSHLEARSRPFLLLAILQRSAVFSSTPSTSRQ